jgi:sterol desaturase/sphingolipid hydroxylase (fatty acid hydroxylase superfamily)
MADLLDFFKNMPEWHMVVWLAACIVFCWLLEVLIPQFRFDYNKFKHDAFNLGIFVMNLVLVAPIALALAMVAVWGESHQVGLLYYVELPVWAELLVAILFLDLIAQYGVHYLLHHVRWMWRLHIVHHSDTHVDATTATRHHPGDAAFRLVASIVAIVVVGIPGLYYVVYRLITPFFGYFTHANIRLPAPLDRLISYVLVTPDMHKFHHHYQAPWTDSNFGNIFSFWDRMFGTLVYANTQDIRYGLDLTDDSRDLDFKYQMTLPIDASINTSVRPGM